eukprot:TRINITY_DN10623_c0_g1_i1.p1 TRINITY_DN10623_c0_g1~~TRINITY_DN10623_c0_g1_i1.p1  ORF type:complete len:636 (+),score=125.64 TRINITY_DN10623_c0_g1_i1:38-1945(+)
MNGMSSSSSYESENVTVEYLQNQIKLLTVQLESTSSQLGQAVDNGWLFVAGAFVFLMQLGFTLVEVGSVRKHFIRNILFKNVLNPCVTIITWWICGYAFSFGGGHSPSNGNRFIGNENFFWIDCPKNNNFDITQTYAFIFFQWVFCCTSCSIVSGAAAERMKFPAYLLGTIFMSCWTYPVVAHWIFSYSGWLSSFGPAYGGIWEGTGLIDFAGSAVVHICGGTTALIAAILAGYRGKYNFRKKEGRTKSSRSLMTTTEEGGNLGNQDDASTLARFARIDGRWIVNELPAYEPTFVVAGTMMLWYGWYGFNPGSSAGLTNYKYNVSGRAAVNTTLSPAASAFAALITGRIISKIKYIITKEPEAGWSLSDMLNGILAGLVGVTGSCAVVDTWAAVVIGIVSGFVFKCISELFLKFRIDDPVDAAAVHLGAGFWGCIAAGLFADNSFIFETYGVTGAGYGLFVGGGGRRLAVQLLGAVTVASWSTFFAFASYGPLVAFDFWTGKTFGWTLFFERGYGEGEILTFGVEQQKETMVSAFIIPGMGADAPGERELSTFHNINNDGMNGATGGDTYDESEEESSEPTESEDETDTEVERGGTAKKGEKDEKKGMTKPGSPIVVQDEETDDIGLDDTESEGY